MDKWEYKVIKYSTSNDYDNQKKNSNNLEQLGLDGWELCGVVTRTVNSLNGGSADLLFKRKIMPAEPKQPKQLSKNDITKLILDYE
jgi:hypothetical protein